jgi:nucleoside phosphorylase
MAVTQTFSHIGVVAPTLAEQEPLLQLLKQMVKEEVTMERRGIWSIHHVKMDNLRISIICSSIGMVNAGAATEALIIHEQPQGVLNYGIAGAHIHDAFPGDIIVATHVCMPFNGYLRQGGMLDSVRGIQWEDETEDYQAMKRRFLQLACDPALVVQAQLASRILIEKQRFAVIAPVGQKKRLAQCFSGVIASADTYCQDETTFARIHSLLGSLCEDMESAAVGQIATRHGLPFAIIRCLSNNDLLEALTAERKKAIYPQMMQRAALLMAQFLRVLADQRMSERDKLTL